MTSFGEPLKGDGFLSDRLLAVLRAEMAALETGRGAAAEGEAATGRGSRAAKTGEEAPASAKGRIEAISQMTRTFEKLLELKRLEVLAARGEDEESSAQTRRLRDEMMRRLRALDARRAGGATLFGGEAHDGSGRLKAVVA